MTIPSPSLNDLAHFTNQNRNHFNEDEHRSIACYLSDIHAKYSDGYYWLKGQLKLMPDEQITQTKIDNAIAIDHQRKAEYGGPCNGLEAASMNHHEYKFTNLQKVIQKYFTIMEEELFRPPDPTDNSDSGGDFYTILAEKTQIGKK
jgi:hypothetical protein